MARRDRSGHGLNAVRVVGGLLPPEFLQTIARLDAKWQTGTDYGLSKSLVLKDEIARYWRIANDLYAAYDERRRRADLEVHRVTVDEWLTPLFKDVLGYADLVAALPATIGDRTFPITHTALSESVPIVLTIGEADLDKADPRFGDEGRRRAPYGLVQELLNADEAKLWGIVSNGVKLRLLRDNPTLTRPAFIEADLARIFDEQLYADFAALWLTAHASRLRPNGKPSSCVLEAWRSQANEIGERALEHLRDGVTSALRSLGNGFTQHPENDDLRDALRTGRITADSYFQELLRLVYRLLFLFAAEDRHLLHALDVSDEERVLYCDGFSVARLRDRALRRRHYDRHSDLWRGLLIVFSALSQGAPALGLPALGGLFNAQQSPNLDAALISNDSLLEAIRALGYFTSDGTLSRVNYRDMGTEELGSVYESLLELHPYVDVNVAPWAFGFVGEDNGEKTNGSARKVTGSYYTPSVLVQELIASALEPIMAQNLAEASNPRETLLALKIVDPACGSGHFLLAAARRIAAEIARCEADSDTPDEIVRQHALREVVQHCIYGVDRNPLAVELCKAALWIETVEPGKPLTFLDSHIQCGDSLVGVLNASMLDDAIPDDAYKPLSQDSASVCKDLKRRNRADGASFQGDLFDQFSLRTVSEMTGSLDSMPEETLDQISEKRSAWERAQHTSARRREELLANLFVGAFFAEKTTRTASVVPVSEDLARLKNGMVMRAGVEEFVTELAERHKFFHWHLAFPDIMQRGGFDVALGNPPWDVSQLAEEEYFAVRAPYIARLSGVRRKKAISALVNDRPDLWDAYQNELRSIQAANSYARGSGRFDLTARGKINLYSLFSETFLDLLASDGRAGLIVPTGIATDNSTKAFFEHLVRGRHLVSLFDFENRERIFPSVYFRVKFCLLTLGSDSERFQFAFYATNVADLGEIERRFELTPGDISLINPNTRTCPILRSRADADLMRKIYTRMPVLLDRSKGNEGNAWGLAFRQGLFNITSESALFRTTSDFEKNGSSLQGTSWTGDDGPWVPLYEAKMVNFYNHRYGDFRNAPEKLDTDYREIPQATDAVLANPEYEPMPRYWVAEQDVQKALSGLEWRHDWLLGWRDITNATNERTMIVSPFPRFGAAHNLSLMFPAVETRKIASLIACLASTTMDYIARQKIGGTHLSFFYVEQLPMLRPDSLTEDNDRYIVPRITELCYTSSSMSAFARELGYDGMPFRWDADRRLRLRAELDAYVARLYGLTRDELRFILDPTAVYGADYPSETFRVLKEREIRQYGEYRTAQLTLEAWDRIESEQTLKSSV